jgi:hypothetical protein
MSDPEPDPDLHSICAWIRIWIYIWGTDLDTDLDPDPEGKQCQNRYIVKNVSKTIKSAYTTV